MFHIAVKILFSPLVQDPEKSLASPVRSSDGAYNGPFLSENTPADHDPYNFPRCRSWRQRSGPSASPPHNAVASARPQSGVPACRYCNRASSRNDACFCPCGGARRRNSPSPAVLRRWGFGNPDNIYNPRETRWENICSYREAAPGGTDPPGNSPSPQEFCDA